MKMSLKRSKIHKYLLRKNIKKFKLDARINLNYPALKSSRSKGQIIHHINNTPHTDVKIANSSDPPNFTSPKMDS